MKVFDPTLQWFGGQSVSSIYIRKDINNFVEFGWSQRRPTVGYAQKVVFLKLVSGGVVYDCGPNSGDVSYEENAPANGDNYRFYIYQNTGETTFRFKYRRPDGTERVIPCTYASWSFITAKAFVATEIAKQGSSADQPGAYHKNVWVQYGDFTYHRASSVNGLGLVWVEDQITYWNPQIQLGGTQNGDSVSYVHV